MLLLLLGTLNTLPSPLAPSLIAPLHLALLCALLGLKKYKKNLSSVAHLKSQPRRLFLVILIYESVLLLKKEHFRISFINRLVSTSLADSFQAENDALRNRLD